MAQQLWLVFCVAVTLGRCCVSCELISSCCPEPCLCSCDCVRVSCYGKGLTDIPRLPLATRYLNMSGNKLQRFPDLDNTKLLVLDLSNNSVSTMKGLDKLGNLTFLNLSVNNLNTLTAFSNVYLKKLDLSRNNISEFEPDVLEKLVHLRYLSLNSNQLRRISTFSNSMLRELDLSYNLISEIEPGCLGKLRILYFIDLSGNNLTGNTNLSLMAFPPSLGVLHLEGIEMEYLTKDLVESLSNTSLITLYLRNNHLKKFTGRDVFPHLPHLTTLDVSYNKLIEFTMAHSKSLRHLYLDHNKLENVPTLQSSDQSLAPKLATLSLKYNYIRTVRMNKSKSLEFLSLSSNQMADLPVCCIGDVKLLPNLRELFVDDNCIRELKMERINCLSHLSLFNISATKIETIESSAFSQLSSLTTLVMEFIQNLNSIKPHAFNSSTLRRLFIKGNHYRFRRSKIKQIFDSCPGITNLDLSSNDMVLLRHSDWYFFENMKNITYLDISDNSILYLPQAIPKFLKFLTTFHFKSNDAGFIPRGYFRTTENIESLLMNNNKFTVIHRDQLPKNLSKLKKINLSFNSFECNCDLQWFIGFARKSARKGTIYRYPKYYNCGNVKNMSIDNARISPHGCILRQEINMIIKCTCISVISLLVLFCIVYRYRYRLRYFVYILNYNRRKYSRIPPALRNDVYVSCSEKDFGFVYDNIVDKMERYGLRIYFPQRDAMAGSMIVSSTLDNIDTSRVVLVCLSDSYAQDYWCEFEACMALERSVCESRRTLIVLVLEEICSLNVTKVVNRLMRDYIEWDVDNERNNEDNWRRLLNEIEVNRPDLVIN